MKKLNIHNMLALSFVLLTMGSHANWGNIKPTPSLTGYIVNNTNSPVTVVICYTQVPVSPKGTSSYSCSNKDDGQILQFKFDGPLSDKLSLDTSKGVRDILLDSVSGDFVNGTAYVTIKSAEHDPNNQTNWRNLAGTDVKISGCTGRQVLINGSCQCIGGQSWDSSRQLCLCPSGQSWSKSDNACVTAPVTQSTSGCPS